MVTRATAQLLSNMAIGALWSWRAQQGGRQQQGVVVPAAVSTPGTAQMAGETSPWGTDPWKGSHRMPPTHKQVTAKVATKIAAAAGQGSEGDCGPGGTQSHAALQPPCRPPAEPPQFAALPRAALHAPPAGGVDAPAGRHAPAASTEW